MKKLLKSFIFIIGFIILSILISSIFKFKYKDGIEPLEEFYKMEENSLDVMFIGSSRVFIGINPAVIWKEQGIRSYDLGGSMQPLWNSYYYIKEALKYQSPEVIVVDVCMAGNSGPYGTSGTIIKNNLGLKLSFDKIESIKVSAPKEDWMDLFLEVPTYHYRYKELTKRDFQLFTGRETVYINGYHRADEILPQDTPDVMGITEERELSSKNLEYLMKIIELAKEENLKLLLITMPYPIEEEHQKIYNTISRIAEENQVDFINYNLKYDELTLDFSSDFADISHLNAAGSKKLSSHLGKYLQERFQLEDKRNDSRYQEWNLWEAAVSREY